MKIKKSYLRSTLSIIGLILSFAITIISATINIAIDPTAIYTTAFWTRWLINTIGCVSAYLLMLNWRHQTNVEQPAYVEKEEIIRQMAMMVDADIADWLANYNLNSIKKPLYIRWKKEAIIALKSKQLTIRNHAVITAKDEAKLANLQRKIDTLTAQLTPEYIDTNLPYLHVPNYHPITKSQLYNAEDVAQQGRVIQSQNKFYGGRTVNKVIRSALLTAVFSSLVVNGWLTTTALIITIITSVFNICLNMIVGFNTANQGYNRIMVPNQINRSAILKQYVAERDKPMEVMKNEPSNK